MSSPADVIYQFLQDEGFDESGIGFFVSFLPDLPDESICIYDTAGRFDGRIMRTGEWTEHSGIQVQVRSLDYPTGWARANAIALAFDSVKNNLVAISSEESYTLQNVSRSGAIIPIGIETLDDRKRHVFTINAVITAIKQT